MDKSFVSRIKIELLSGAGTGLVFAVIHLVLVKLVPRREGVREALFGAVLSFFTGRGLAGQMSVRASVFFVLVGLFGITFVAVSRRYFPPGNVVRGKPAAE